VRTLLAAVTLILGILILSLALEVVFRVPAFTILLLQLKFAPSCKAQSQAGRNAGALITLDVRGQGGGGKFTGVLPAAWAAAAASRIQAATSATNDLVVYVHGFDTTVADAQCIGENIRADLAELPRYEMAGPDVVVFTWPSEFGFDFGAAQRNAQTAGDYLGRALAGVSGRRLYMVAHSLGAKVAMESARALPELEGMLLVEGAIRAITIRTWTQRVSVRSPFGEALSPRTSKPVVVEERLETGKYVNAAAKARHLVVTIGANDAVLSDAYSLDAFVRTDADAPQVPPWVGEAPEDLPQNIAIGSPFPSNPVYRRDDRPFPGAKPQPGRLAPVAPADTWTSTSWCYWFTVPHPSFHELKLSDGPRLYGQHSALGDGSMRRYLLTKSWSFFSLPESGKPPADPPQLPVADRCSFFP